MNLYYIIYMVFILFLSQGKRLYDHFSIHKWIICKLIRYWVCLSVCYRNHLPLVQFQNEAHIQNSHGEAEVWRPFVFIYFFAAAEGGTPGGRAKDIAEAAVSRGISWICVTSFKVIDIDSEVFDLILIITFVYYNFSNLT